MKLQKKRKKEQKNYLRTNTNKLWEKSPTNVSTLLDYECEKVFFRHN